MNALLLESVLVVMFNVKISKARSCVYAYGTMIR